MPVKNEPAVNDLYKIRHSCAHLLAAAVKQIWKQAKNAIGPAIEHGFYQDFDMGDVHVTEEDLKKIEEKMREILRTWHAFMVREVPVEQARKDFADNPYKLELIEEFAKLGKTITENDPGNFLDLCKGGHSDDPQKELQHFRLLSIAGAYWRGDEKNKMLTRIYGTAFSTKKELDEYLHRLEEAKKRDHKILGSKLKLFTHSALVGSGLPLFLPKGATILRLLEQFITDAKLKRGYSFVRIPHLAKDELYKKSGHLGKYDAMMPPIQTEENEHLVIKPMNCPHHFELYRSEKHSYRELPLRYAENTTVYRNEKSGELNGLFRVRALEQDDTHHFVRHDQIGSEIQMILNLMKEVYEKFGFTDYRCRISTRNPENLKKYFGDDALWNLAEKTLKEEAEKWGAPYFVGEGEAAFYGPKIDVMVRDAIGREWQLTTVQLDFTQPENFDLTYIGEDGKEHRPAVLHVAVLGSYERFLGILIEHYAGAFPAFLAPIQTRVINVTKEIEGYAEEVYVELKKHGIRADLDASNETLGKRIRNAELEKIPYILVVGEKEKADHTIAVREYATKKQEIIPLDDAIKKFST